MRAGVQIPFLTNFIYFKKFLISVHTSGASVLQQPVLPLDVPVLQQKVLPKHIGSTAAVLLLNDSDLQQHFQPSDASVLQLPVLLLDVSFLYSSLCCLWRVCSTSARGASGVSVLQKPVLLLDDPVLQSPCCFWRVCSTAA
jgi:hypothetical protein